jgi:hypothetical protein
MAQEPVAAGDKTDKLIYRHESSLGLNINSNGWGAGYRWGKHYTGRIRRMLDFDLVKMKNSKEVRVVNANIQNSKSFIFGKLNALSILRTGVGTQNVLFGKESTSSVEIRYSLFVGASWGLAKPIYLKIINDPASQYVTYEQFDPQKHSVYNIQGRAPYSYGLDKLKIHPGLYGKFALSFEYGAEDEYTKIIETGCIFDFYPKPVEILVFNKPQPLFFTLYASIIMGRKWF